MINMPRRRTLIPPEERCLMLFLPFPRSKEGSGSGKSKGKRKTSKRKKVSSPALVARRMSNPDTGGVFCMPECLCVCVCV